MERLLLFVALCGPAAALLGDGTAGNKCSEVPGWNVPDIEVPVQPVLDVAASNLGDNVLDTLEVYFWNPETDPDDGIVVFNFQDAWIGDSQGPSTGSSVSGPTTTSGLAVASGRDGHAEATDSRCYTRRVVSIAWASFIANGDFERTEDADYVSYAGTLFVHNERTPQSTFRGAPSNSPQTNKQEHPFIVKFKKGVSALVSSLSVFKSPENLPFLSEQSLSVNIADLETVATVKVVTSLQWPFKFVPAGTDVGDGTGAFTPDFWRVENNTIVTSGVWFEWDHDSGSAGLERTMLDITLNDCPDYHSSGAGDVVDGTGPPQFSCTQTWTIRFKPPKFLDDAVSKVCTLDGTYRVQLKAYCQPSYEDPTKLGLDCPLVQNSDGSPDLIHEFDINLHSEDYCPKTLASVEASAAMRVYKQLAHTEEATNFVQGQHIYFVVQTDSTDATITSAAINSIYITDTRTDLEKLVFSRDIAAVTGPYAPGTECQLELASGGTNDVNDLCEVEALRIHDGCKNDGSNPWDGCETGGAADSGKAPGSQAWFDFVLSDGAFSVATDSAFDFTVRVVVDITFQDVSAVPANVDNSPNALLERVSALSSRDSLSVSSSFSLAGALQPTQSDSSSETSSSEKLALAPFLLLMVGAGFLRGQVV